MTSKRKWLYKKDCFRNLLKKKWKTYNPKLLKQKAKKSIEIDDKQLKKELAEEKNNPYYFTGRALKIGLNESSERHHINHANSKIIIKPFFPEFERDFQYFNKILNEMAPIHARLINQHEFIYQTVISARFHKQDEVGKMLDEIE